MADIQMSGSSVGYGGASSGAGDRSNNNTRGALKAGVSVTTLTNAAGALVSLALIVGVGMWGYKLLVRDVTGIPVVRAAEGPMRVAPKDPGGQQADHQGLAVNEVAGRGTASGPADRVALAPQTVGLEAEDEPGQTLAPIIQDARATASRQGADDPPHQAANVEEDQDKARTDPVRRIMTNRVTGAPETETGAEGAPIQNAAIQALADQIAAGSARLSPTAPAPNASAPSRDTPAPEQTAAAPVIDAPGVRRSPRPKRRPNALQATAAAAAAAAGSETRPAEAAARIDVDAASLPSGTRLVQLGAYESAEVAREEWTRIAGRFDTFFDEKKRVIQKAQSGGRTFYRLRAQGFDDLADARRFCAALVAERADCIPVVIK